MEKRLYRKGWYVEHDLAIVSVQNNPVPRNNFVQVNGIHEKFQQAQIIAIHKTEIDTNVIVRKRKQTSSDEQTANGSGKRMTYRQAKEKLDEKGVSPNDRANTLFWLSVASIPLFLFSGIGIFIAIGVLLFSGSAKEKIIAAGGNYTSENLAIVNAAKRIAWGVVITEIALGIIGIALILLLFSTM
ncbi:MAG TPA: hypothetical protein VFJ43_13915 [Bacteroidia bacterium]|nr:hypothetical protein [Bacteroidia bacterium]